MSGMANTQHLIAFFDPTICGPDPDCRRLDDILSWPDSHLEYSHDYIQNLFPLPEGSMFNSAIWLVTADAYHAFRQRPELRERFSTAMVRICKFYGLQIVKDETAAQHSLSIVRAGNFAQVRKRWVSRFNHNHLRITRILRSLRVLGLEDHCAAFHEFLTTDTDVKAAVSETSQMYWTRAATRPLHLPPDEGDDTAKGISWLAELER